MVYNAKVIEIMIACPSDVAYERTIVRDVIASWNAIHARDRSIVLLPVSWDTHSSPELGGRPQQMINERLLAHADILVGIFWTRVGTPTGKAISGSVEEIEEHHNQGKPVMLYLSSAPVVPDSLDHDQYEKLKRFKSWAKERGLIESYDSKEQFREKFQHQLQIALRDNPALRNVMREARDDAMTEPHEGGFLSDDARALLTAAASADGLVLVARYIGGTDVQASNKQFAKPNDRRSIARWLAAVEELTSHGMLQDMGGKGEVFEVTHRGYQVVGNAN